MMYKEFETPMIYGILFTENAKGATPETAFYKSERDRDEAVERIKETSYLFIGTTPGNSPYSEKVQRSVKVFAFSLINAEPIFYRADKTHESW